MLRAVLLGLLAISATSSCSRSEEAKVAPGAVAGKVLEVSGKVAATRDGRARDLAAGAEVFGDDVVETSADGSVVILLSHNNARWAVEGGQRTRVDASAAWRLAKQDAPAKPVDHATSAAGRDGERTAAETRAMTEAAPAAEERRGGGGGGGAPDGAAAPAQAAPKPTRTRAPAPEPAPPAPPPPEPAATGAAENRSADPMPADAKADKPPLRQQKTAPPRAAIETYDGPNLSQLLEAHRAELRKCLGATSPKLTLRVRVAAGARKAELPGTVAAPVRACIDGVIERIDFAGPDTTATIELAR